MCEPVGALQEITGERLDLSCAWPVSAVHKQILPSSLPLCLLLFVPQAIRSSPSRMAPTPSLKS